MAIENLKKITGITMKKPGWMVVGTQDERGEFNDNIFDKGLQDKFRAIGPLNMAVFVREQVPRKKDGVLAWTTVDVKPAGPAPAPTHQPRTASPAKPVPGQPEELSPNVRFNNMDIIGEVAVRAAADVTVALVGKEKLAGDAAMSFAVGLTTEFAAVVRAHMGLGVDPTPVLELDKAIGNGEQSDSEITRMIAEAEQGEQIPF